MIKNKIVTTLILAKLLILGLVTGCDKLEDMVRFNFADSTEIVVPSQSVISTGFIKIPSPEIQTSSKQAFENNKTEAKYVKDARLTELKLTITSPQSQTFSFLNEIKIYISAPNLDEVLIASKTNIPTSIGKELYLDINNINLKPYIQADSYSIRTEAKVDEVTTQEVRIRADMNFRVTADVF